VSRAQLHAATAAFFGSALALAMYVPDHKVGRVLEMAALASLLPATGLARVVRAATAVGSGAGGIVSIAWFGVLVSAAAFLVDPAVHEQFATPKNYMVLGASAAAILGYAAWRALRRAPRAHVTWIEVLLAAAVLWGFVSNPQWFAADEAIRPWLAVALLLLTFVTRQLFSSEGGAAPCSRMRSIAARDLFVILWINGVALALFGLRQAFDHDTFRYTTGVLKTPMIGLVGVANGYGAFLAAGIIGALVTLCYARSRFARVLLGGAVLLQLAALLGNGSRGALLGLFAAALVVGWSRLLSVRTRALTATVAAAGALTLMVVSAYSLHLLDPASGRGRVHAWTISVAMAADHPLRGVGAGRYAASYASYQAELWREPEHARWANQAARRTQPHSELAHALAERGVPGITLHLLLWAVALGSMLHAVRATGRASPWQLGLLGLCTAIAAHSAVDATMLWVPTALTAHLALGLVPAPPPGGRAVAWGGRGVTLPLTFFAMLYGAVIGVKTAREYRGYELARQGMLAAPAAGLPALTEARARVPGMARLSLPLAKSLLAAGMPDDAIASLEAALVLRDDLDIRLALATAYLQAGDPERAEAHALVALASFPDRLMPQLIFAKTRQAVGDHEAARAALARCIRLETRFRTPEVDAVADEARVLWRKSYSDPPPG
jgi:tetratricopeptide (TPR) repeat protein